MGFQSVDELEHFSFRDCQINTFRVTEEGLFLEVEALIVKANNSQNTNYTDSYAGTTQIRLLGGELLSGFQEGYKYYDANDVLVNEVPDKPLPEAKLKGLPKKCAGAYLFAMEKREPVNGKQHYAIGIEFAEDSDYGSNLSETYHLEISFQKAVVNWEQYMNRVQD